MSVENYNRENAIKEKLNRILVKVTGEEREFVSNISIENLISLKSALSEINNALTLKTTIECAKWLTKYLKMSDKDGEILKDKILKIKPNTNGFDIQINNPKNVIVEIKAIVPINDGEYFGAAQRNAILDDAIKLLKGKKEVPDTKSYIKIIGIMGIGEKTLQAINKLIIPAKNIRTNQVIRLNRHDVVNKLKIIDIERNMTLENDYVYIKIIKLNTEQLLQADSPSTHSLSKC